MGMCWTQDRTSDSKEKKFSWAKKQKGRDLKICFYVQICEASVQAQTKNWTNIGGTLSEGLPAQISGIFYKIGASCHKPVQANIQDIILEALIWNRLYIDFILSRFYGEK